jgi:hypothetical protein
MAEKIGVYLEIGKKRAFAGALDWPGWNRIGRDEEEALQALVGSAPRYDRVLSSTGLNFARPATVADLVVVERLEGSATTDFGAPDAMPAADREPVDEASLQRFQTLLDAYWAAFTAAVASAEGRELRKGPRGGGRDLDAIVDHVLNAESSYLKRLGWKPEVDENESPDSWIQRTREAEKAALAAGARGELPERGPRGGKIWPPRYFVRRAGWHILDHAWEIEDRIL